ncbi:hypothetical protein HQQ80_08950 [Microbacteriaceae bacterium VKM Ac-2855]|nr:hypothetical protein [Microbacteriaceae bacterium VKM Ac-2855]
MLAVIVLIGAGTVLRGRAHGIQRMSGRSSAGILLHELAALLRPVLIFAAGTVAVLATTMYLYNGFAHAAALLTLACRLISVLLVAGLGAHVVGIVITAGRDVLDQVKGEIDGVWALVGAYAVRLPAVFVLLSIIAALGQSVYLAQIEGQTRAYWAQAGDAVTLTVSGNLTDTELNVARSTVAELARKRDSDHGVVLAQRDALAPALTDALVVNQEYLQQVPVLDTNGDRLTTVLSDAITVLVPDDAAAAQVVAAHAAAADWYQFEHSLTLSDIPDPATVPINDARTQAGQNLFTFRTGTGNVMNGPAIAANPVIVVLPSLQFIPQSELFAAVTNGSIVFTDPDTLRADVRAMDLNPAVSAIQPVAYQANESYRQALGAVTINIAGLVAAIVVVALTALIVGVVTVEKNRQRLFVQHLSGWSFAATHRTTFILEAGLILAVTAISLAAAWTRDPLTVQSVIDTGTVDTESYLINQSLIALATAGAAAALLVASLALAHARMLRSHSADA